MSDESESPAEEQTNELADRIGGRFADNDTSDIDAMSETSNMSATSDKDEMDAKSETNTQSAWTVDSVREAWNGTTFYLPDEMRDQLDDEFRRVEYELGGEIDGTSLKKDRHFKPLVISVGLDRLQEMDAEEIEAALREMMDDEL